jgi:5-methylcytosine-specific restriction protein B
VNEKISREEFIKRYEKFRQSLPPKDSKRYAKLYTKDNTPFRACSNSKGITVKAFTSKETPLSISLEQLQKIYFESKEPLFKSYEPVILERILKEELISESEIESRIGKEIKNIILYGVPGVGKTHNINNLIYLIERGTPQITIFEEIEKNKKRDKRNLRNIKDRVAFVTFHQSFGYEDFIEGFRPNEEGKIELVDGVFKNICKEAQKNLKESTSESSFDFESFFNDFVNFVENKYRIELDNGLYIKVSKNSNGEFQSFITEGRVDNRSLTYKIIKRDFENFIKGDIRGIKDIKPPFNSNRGYHINAPYYLKLYQKMREFLNRDFDRYKIENRELKNYYLIIDEINRANISKVFGELITLIEEDKRDNLEVILPYSKEPFTVPSNLYIIGTMNSADKSIALIDIALRRRFTFLKIRPNEKLIKHQEARELFERLNEYIERTLGEEYLIGHSYFMDIETDEELKFIINYKIKPLLEEYYYGDENIIEVLELIEEY